MEARQYQTDAIEWLARHKLGLVVSPAGSGKTLIAAGAIHKVVMAKARNRKVRVGWVGNTLEQVQQAHAALASFPNMAAAIDAKVACAAANTDWSDRDVLVVDEAGHAPARQWRAQIETCQGARWAFTATPDGDNLDRNAELRALFGGNEYVVPREAVATKLAAARVILLPDTDTGLRGVIDKDIECNVDAARRRYGSWVAKQNYDAVARRVLAGAGAPAIGHLEMCVKFAGLKDAVDAKLRETVFGILWSRISWQVCAEHGIVNNRARNDAAVAAALRHKDGHVLMLVNQVEHGKTLAERIPGALMAFSKMGAKKRAAALDAFRSGACRCLVATSLADEGLDLPMADVLVLVSGGKSQARTEQRTGRVLRQFSGKTVGIIYDWQDAYHPLAAKHAAKRQELYRRLGYSMPPVAGNGVACAA